jgi:hypothetical protein
MPAPLHVQQLAAHQTPNSVTPHFLHAVVSIMPIAQVLEELAISVQQNLISKLPFCAFNGGNDVFVDVGNKSIGLDALMRHLDCYPYEVSSAAASAVSMP